MKIRILLVDDDLDDRDNFMEAIHVLGVDADVTYAENGLVALEMMTSPDFKRPQLMFLDLNMPKLDGLELLAQMKVRNLLRGVPVIVLSTSLDPHVESQCLALGARECIVKPMWFRPLLFQIKTVLNTYLRYYVLV